MAVMPAATEPFSAARCAMNEDAYEPTPAFPDDART
jgi:hypothetical protein